MMKQAAGQRPTAGRRAEPGGDHHHHFQRAPGGPEVARTRRPLVDRYVEVPRRTCCSSKDVTTTSAAVTRRCATRASGVPGIEQDHLYMRGVQTCAADSL